MLQKIAEIFVCPGCLGGCQVASDASKTPWLLWLEEPLKNCAAVISGEIRPITCPQCVGTGEIRAAFPSDPPKKTRLTPPRRFKTRRSTPRA